VETLHTMLTNRLTGTTETNGGLRNEHHDSPPRTQPHPTAESSAIPIRARSRGQLLTSDSPSPIYHLPF